MLLKDAFREGTRMLEEAHIEAPAVDAGVLLCHTLNRNRIFLYAHGDDVIPEEKLSQYYLYIKQRAEGRPVQYITGVQEFMSLLFDVTPDVLIPRQDTEILVERVIRHAEGYGGRKLGILDIGTGSGCIAVSLAKYIGNCSITALDISEKAIEVARRNAVRLGMDSRVRFMQSNLFDGLLCGNDDKDSFDIIVSNPPYIQSAVIGTLQREVGDFEPLGALDGGEDGLFFYRRIVEGAPSFLKAGGFLALEIGYDQGEPVSALLKKSFDAVEVIRDYSGNDRVVCGRLKTPCL